MGTRRGHQPVSRQIWGEGRGDSTVAFGDAMHVLSTLHHNLGRSEVFQRHLHDETDSEKLWQSLARRADGN